MRCLFFCLAQCGCTVKAAHIQGCCNVAVDGGMATTAAKVESKDSIIKTLSCWESTAYLQYMKIPRARLAGYTMQLAKESRAGQWAGRPQWRHPVRRLLTLQTWTKFSVLAVVQSDTHLLSFMYSNILCFFVVFLFFFLDIHVERTEWHSGMFLHIPRSCANVFSTLECRRKASKTSGLPRWVLNLWFLIMSTQYFLYQYCSEIELGQWKRLSGSAT